MKNLFIVIFLVAVSNAFGQTDSTKTALDRKHEVKIGAVKLLVGPILEGTYEYIYSSDFTFGSSILASFVNDQTYYAEDFSITPFARFYFQEKKDYGANGFFVEGFLKYSTGRYHSYDAYDEYYQYETEFNPKKYSVAVAGFALGKKWINKSGFVFEILAGAGRTLGNSQQAPDYFFRGDFNIGYRF